MPRHRAAPAFAHFRPVRQACQRAFRVRHRAAADVRLDEVRGRLGDSRKQGVRVVLLLKPPCAFGQVDGGAVGAAPRQLQQSEHRCRVGVDRARAGPAGEFESGRDVRPAILIVSEDRLGPGQDHQREGRQGGLPGLGGELDGLGGGGECRRHLAAPELELREKGQGKGQDGRGARRSGRADDAIEHRAGVRPLLDPHQQLSDTAEHKRKLAEHVDRLQRPEYRLEHGKGLAVAADGRFLALRTARVCG
jgi:hypothetical protein